jgi:DNA invertase Pin-like site-specific DNA recombinase
MDKRVRVALYCRVSSEDQKKKKNVDMQLSDLRRYCEQRDFRIYKEYSDEGISGTKDRRPALDELMADAQKRRFDAVLVWRFDRFARSTKHLITALEEFRHLGTDFISYQENIDTSSPLGKAIFTIVSAISELERSIIIERVKSGLRRRKEKGLKLGPPIKLNLDIDQLRELRGQGLSFSKIGKLVGACPATIYQTLKKNVSESPVNQGVR